MKKDTRQEILGTARELFNERGYNGVSLRDIADELGISKGNLTYHFAKKEEIMEALLDSSPRTKPNEPPVSIEELNAFFLDMQEAVQRNAYYFLHYTQLSQLSPAIREKQVGRYAENVRLLTESFAALREKGLFLGESFPGEDGQIIDCLHLTSVYWQSLAALKNEEAGQGSYQRHAWGLLHHRLTQQGKEALAGVIEM